MEQITLSQKKEDQSGGCTGYLIVASHPTAGQVEHEYCCYHPMAGPVRPDPVTNLRLEGGQVKWEWSENAFDLASPGSCSERPLQIKDNVLEWSGPVQKTAKPKRRSPEPTKVLAETERLRAQDLELKDGDDPDGGSKKAVIVTHKPTGTSVKWGDWYWDDTYVRNLKCADTGKGYVAVEFVHYGNESGEKWARNVCVYVKLGSSENGSALQWVKEK